MTATRLVHQLYQRFRDLIHELGKFGIVGIFAFGVDTGLYALLLWAGDMEGDRTLLAKTIATVVAATLAFIGNRFWTWRHRPRSGLAREYLLYFGFNAAGLGISLATVWATHWGLGEIWPVFTSPAADVISGQIVGNAFATVFRFWGYRRFVFAEAPAEVPVAGQAKASPLVQPTRVR